MIAVAAFAAPFAASFVDSNANRIGAARIERIILAPIRAVVIAFVTIE